MICGTLRSNLRLGSIENALAIRDRCVLFPFRAKVATWLRSVIVAGHTMNRDSVESRINLESTRTFETSPPPLGHPTIGSSHHHTIGSSHDPTVPWLGHRVIASPNDRSSIKRNQANVWLIETNQANVRPKS